MFAPVVPISLAAALNGTSRIRHLRDWRDSATKYCDRCMVRKMTDFYNALDEHEFSEGMPEYQAIVNY